MAEDALAVLKRVKLGTMRGNYVFAPGTPFQKSVMLLSKKLIPKGERGKAKKSPGCSKVYFGVCFKEEGIKEVVFEINKKPPKALEICLRNYVKKCLGLKSFEFVFRFDPTLDDEGEADTVEGVVELPVLPATCAKVAKAWMDTRAALQKRLDGIKAAIVAEYKGHPQKSHAKKAADGLDVVLEKLGPGAARKLAAAAKAASEDEQMTLVTGALGDFSAYQTYVNGDPLVAALSASPFGKVPVKDIATKVIAAVTPKLAPTPTPTPA